MEMDLREPDAIIDTADGSQAQPLNRSSGTALRYIGDRGFAPTTVAAIKFIHRVRGMGGSLSLFLAFWPDISFLLLFSAFWATGVFGLGKALIKFEFPRS
jgi:hypothetical protein